jgi:hypothetical protein
MIGYHPTFSSKELEQIEEFKKACKEAKGATADCFGGCRFDVHCRGGFYFFEGVDFRGGAIY